MKIFPNLLVFGCDLVGTPSDALAANLTRRPVYETEHFVIPLAAERAVAIAHDAISERAMPHSESGAVALIAVSADLIAVYVLGGTASRSSQFQTADHDRPVSFATAFLPPSAAMTSLVVRK